MDKKPIAIGKLTDMVDRISAQQNPFLYYLPGLMQTAEFKNINPENAVRFVELALKDDPMPIVNDALKILNRIVDPELGKLRKVASDMFYENRSFFWSELGGHTKTIDVITHIFNKVVFSQSLGN